MLFLEIFKRIKYSIPSPWPCLVLVGFWGVFFSGKVESSTCTDILNFLVVLKKKNTKKPAGPANKTAKAGMQLTWGKVPFSWKTCPGAPISLSQCTTSLWLEGLYNSSLTILSVCHNYVFAGGLKIVEWCIQIPNLWQVHTKEDGINYWIH